jgi:hypothetical protein
LVLVALAVLQVEIMGLLEATAHLVLFLLLQVAVMVDLLLLVEMEVVAEAVLQFHQQLVLMAVVAVVLVQRQLEMYFGPVLLDT